MIYLTGSAGTAVHPLARPLGLGLMLQPGNSYLRHLEHYDVWAADNGCYAAAKNGRPFDERRWVRWLGRIPQAGCLFATAPDVLHWRDGECFGDAAATLARAELYLPLIRRLGFRAALVAQDGLERLEVPWDQLDALFVGGSTAFKISEAAYQLAAEARARGKHSHMGRCNTRDRIFAAAAAGYDSADGTKLAFGLDSNLPELRRWLHRIRVQPGLWAVTPA